MYSNEKLANDTSGPIPRSKPPSEAHESPAHDELFRLQRTAGNEAVSSLLVAGGGRVAVQRKEIASGVEESQLEDLDIRSDPGISGAMEQKQHAIARAEKDKGHHNVTITNANFVGGYEHAGADHPVPTMDVGPAARSAGGETLTRLMDDYNAYTPLLQATLRAMGRLKDLDVAGAKIDPAALKSDPKLAAKFEGDPNRGGMAFHAWSGQATDERNAVRSMGAGFALLKAAMSGFRGAQDMLKERQKQAELESAEGKKATIEQTVKTLEKIVDTCFTAVDTAENIEGFLESTRGVMDLEEVEAKESYKETRSGEQSLGRAASWTGQQMKKHHKQVESWLKEGGLTLENVLIFATDNARAYEQLTLTIGSLKKQLSDLHFDEVTRQIEQADGQLQGMKLEIGVRIDTAIAKREEARAAAGDYGRSIAGGEGSLAMFAAQAYQDLAIYGGAADQQRRSRIDPRLGWLYAFLNDNSYLAMGHGWKEDWSVLQAWGQNMVEQREFFSSRQPEWNARARAWNDYMGELTGGPLVRK